MQVGEVVVLVEDVDGIKAGHEGRIMSLRDNMVMVGCRSRDRSAIRLWRIPGRFFRRSSSAVCARGRGDSMSERA